MAGIILDLNDDIKRLQQLSDEVAKLKKQLASININVNLNIADDIARKIKSLKDEYYGLLQTIVDAENKVNASVKNINDALNKVVQEQEKFAKQGAQTAANAGDATKNAQAASVESQAKAYDELEQVIDRVLGTRDENVRLMVREQNAIRILNAQIKEVRKNYTDSDGVVSGRGLQLLEKYNNDLLTHKEALAQARRELSNQAKLNNAAGTSMNALSQSLSRMRIAYRELTEEERKSPFGQELLASIQQADAKIKELDATIGNHQRNVGNYASGFNSLGMSVQQIVRELPAATMGLNMFFLAISNNLPILTDEIKRAVELNKQMKAQNQETIPVWKQLVSSIFSWQTALVVAITAMSMYGKEIVSWVSGLFSARKEINILAGEVNKFNEALANSRKAAGEEIGQLRVLYSQVSNVNLSMEARLAAINKLQQQYPAYFGNLTKEQMLAGDTSAAYRQLTKDIMAAARARAAQERIDELAGRQIQEQRGANADRNFLKRNRTLAEEARKAKAENERLLRERFGDDTSSPAARAFAVESYSRYREQYGNILEEYGIRAGRLERHTKNVQELEKQMQSYTGYIDQAADAMERLERDTPQSGGTTKEDDAADRRLKAQEELDKALLALQQKNQDDEISMMQEGTQKRLKEIDNDYKKRIAEIDKQEAEFKKKNQEAGVTGLISGLTSEQSDELQKARDNATKQQKQDTEKALKEERELHEQSWRDYLKEYGDYQQKREAITEDYNKKIADANKDGDEGLAKSLSAQLEAALRELDFSEFQKAINWDAVFGDLSSLPVTALSTLRSQLKAVKGSLADRGGLSADDTEQLKTLTEAIDRLRSAEIADNPFATLKQGAAEYAQSLKELNDAQAAFDKASSQSYDGTQTLAEAFDEALRAQDGEKMAAVENTEVTIEQTDEFGNVTSVTMKYIDALKQLQKAQNSVTTSSSKLGQSINGIGSKMGQIAQIGSNATELFSSLGIDVPDSIGKALGGLGEMGAAMEAFDVNNPGSFLNVNNYINFAKGVVGAFEGIGEAIGGIFGLGGADYSEYYDMKDKYDQLSEVWDELIAKKKEYIDIDYGIEAQKAGTEALELLSQQEAYARRVAEAAAGAGASVGSHSIAYRQNRDLGGYLDEVRQYTKQQDEALTQTLMNASADELAAIKENMYGMWMGLDGDFRAALEDIIDIKEQSEEIRESMNEAFTGTSFDSFYDGYVDMLADMDNDNLDLAENFEEYLKKSVLSSLVAENYRSRIRQLYKDWAKANKDGNIDTSEAAMLREAQKELADEMIADRDSLAETFGWTSDNLQEAGAKGYETISQDTGEAIDGRLTAMYSLDIEKKSILDTQVQTLTDIKGLLAAMDVQSRGMVDVATETRSILASSYIELQQISENTGALIEPMRKMQIDIAEVKRNTSRI